MPIEFRCPACQKLLRVPDASAGAQAKCPECGAIAAIPSAGTDRAPAADSAAVGSSPYELENPYAAPTVGPASKGPKVSLAAGVEATPADVGEILNYAWEVWKSNLGLLVGVTCVVFGLNFAFGAISATVERVLEVQDGDLAGLGGPLGFVISMVGNVIAVFLGIGQAHIVLKLLRGQPAAFGDLFGGGRLFPRVLGACILAGLAMFAGALACVLPAIILAVIFWPFYWLLVDDKAGVVECFGLAAPIGQANVGTTILIWLASLGIMIVGVLAACVGVLAAYPLTSLVWGTAYLMMSGQINTPARG